MLRRYCDFDENYYAYYSDLESDGQEGSFASIYIGGNMGGNSRQGKLFVLSGPSGVGKTTLARKLLKKLGQHYNMHRVITYTTKLPRRGESVGVDYHYITETEFEAKLSAGFFIEHSKVYGCYYGSPKSILCDLSSGKSFLLVVDQAGAYDIKRQYGDAILIWIIPPSINELISRLEKRATENSIDMQKRLMIARNELATESQRHVFDYVIENNILEQTINDLSSILKVEMTSGSVVC